MEDIFIMITVQNDYCCYIFFSTSFVNLRETALGNMPINFTHIFCVCTAIKCKRWKMYNMRVTVTKKGQYQVILYFLLLSSALWCHYLPSALWCHCLSIAPWCHCLSSTLWCHCLSSALCVHYLLCRKFLSGFRKDRSTKQ